MQFPLKREQKENNPQATSLGYFLNKTTNILSSKLKLHSSVFFWKLCFYNVPNFLLFLFNSNKPIFPVLVPCRWWRGLCTSMTLESYTGGGITPLTGLTMPGAWTKTMRDYRLDILGGLGWWTRWTLWLTEQPFWSRGSNTTIPMESGSSFPPVRRKH